MKRVPRWTLFAVVTAACSTPGATYGQGIIQLPPDGTWVRYQGTVQLEHRRPQSPAGDEQFVFAKHLTISSVGTESADGQPARWVELKA